MPLTCFIIQSLHLCHCLHYCKKQSNPETNNNTLLLLTYHLIAERNMPNIKKMPFNKMGFFWLWWLLDPPLSSCRHPHLSHAVQNYKQILKWIPWVLDCPLTIPVKDVFSILLWIFCAVFHFVSLLPFCEYTYKQAY